jgi:hypothetical protein
MDYYENIYELIAIGHKSAEKIGGTYFPGGLI